MYWAYAWVVAVDHVQAPLPARLRDQPHDVLGRRLAVCLRPVY